MARIVLSGGEKLQARLREIAANLEKSASVDVGFMGGATYPDGESVAFVATMNEFGRGVNVIHPTDEVGGSYYQMPRPFFRRAIKANKDKWAPNIATALKNNNYDATIALESVGQEIQEEVQESIRELVDPPLAPSTIAAKGFDKPLIDSGLMENSVTHLVK